MLTARDSWSDKVAGLDAGADDYLAKPFQTEELIARLRALIRRASGNAISELTAGDVRLDTRSGKVTLDGEPVKLTAQEYKLLSYLMHHKGKVVSRTELIEHIYDQDFDRDSNTIEVFVTRIRKKLGQDVITTIRGLGYSSRSRGRSEGLAPLTRLPEALARARRPSWPVEVGLTAILALLCLSPAVWAGAHIQRIATNERWVAIGLFALGIVVTLRLLWVIFRRPGVRRGHTGSIIRRMIGISALWILLLLGGGGFALDRVLISAITRNFDDQLDYVLTAIIASAEIGPDGEVLLSRPPANQRFLEPNSGLYFQISRAGTASSRAELASRLVGPAAQGRCRA